MGSSMQPVWYLDEHIPKLTKVKKYVTVSASTHIHNAQAKDTRHKLKPAYKKESPAPAGQRNTFEIC